MKELESILVPVMRSRWNLQPIPLSPNAITFRKTQNYKRLPLDYTQRAYCIHFHCICLYVLAICIAERCNTSFNTLDGLADEFSIAKEELMAFNQLKTETINQTMELMIPICESMPTGTVLPATLTATYTPEIRQITSTPGG